LAIPFTDNVTFEGVKKIGCFVAILSNEIDDRKRLQQKRKNLKNTSHDELL